MPGWPLPAKPIPHHEPGKPFRGEGATHQITRLNAQGLEETVELQGIDAMLEDATMSDPFQGNYRLVELDKIMFGSYAAGSPNNFSVQNFEIVSPDLVLTDTVNYGNIRFNAIAAGDLNGDLVDEQIAAWVNPADNHIIMQISEMPGTSGKITSVPAAIAGTTVLDGAAIHFDGVDDYVNVGPNINLNSTSFTVAFWAKRDSTGTSDIVVGQGSKTTNHGLHIGFRSNNVFTCAFWGDDLDTLDAYTDTGWHHWACTYDAGSNQRTIYRDGVQVAHDIAAADYQGTGELDIGRVVEVLNAFDGIIDEVGIWSVARTQGQIQEDKDRWAPDETDLVAYWHFDEGSGWTTVDASGNFHTGTLANGPLWSSENATADDPQAEVHLLVRGYDDSLWHCLYDLDNEICLSWDNLAGGILLSNPAIASRGTGAFDIFAIGTDNQIHQNSWDGATWMGWSKAITDTEVAALPAWTGPTTALEGPAAVASGMDMLDLFRVAPDHTLRWNHFNGSSWGGWQPLGGMLASGSGAISLGDGRMQVYALGMDGALWYRTFDNDWEEWQRWQTPQGVAAEAFPVLTSPAAGKVNVYLAGTENRVWSTHYDGSVWGGWSSTVVQGGDLGQGISAVLTPDGDYIFAQMVDGSLQSSLNASGWMSLNGLDVPQTFETAAITWPVHPDDAIENRIFDMTTGYFSGDGRQQVVLAYEGTDNNLRLEIYDMQDGFQLTNVAALTETIPYAGWPRIAGGDVDGDGRDEIGLVYSHEPDPNDDNSEWQGLVLDVFKIDVDANGQWVISSEPIASEEMMIDDGWDFLDGREFAGTLRIEAGDIIPEDGSRNDEFAIVSDWRHDGSGKDLGAWLHIYDYDDGGSISVIELCYLIAWDDNYGYSDNNLYETGIGLAVGDINGDAVDEVVVTVPYGFDDSDYPDLRRYLRVYGYDPDGTLKQIGNDLKIYGGQWSRNTFLDTLAVGDLDQDLVDEIIMASHFYHGDVNGLYYFLDVYEFTHPDLDLVYRRTLTYSDRPRAFNLAVGDFTGESVRVGPPSYRRQHDVGQVIAVVNAPPKHQDTINEVLYNLNADDADTYSKFEEVTGTSTEVSVTTHKDWGVDSEFKLTVGDPDATHVTTSLENSYGENFEHTGSSIQSLTYQQTIKAITNDVLFYTRLAYDVWEYPVYDSSTNTPQGYMSVVWPAGDMQSVVEPADACDGWYMPNHQLMNVWSYPSRPEQLLDRDGSGDHDLLPEITGYTIGTELINFSVDFSQLSSESRSHQYEMGFATGLETQIGGEEVGVNLGVVSFSTRMPSMFFSARGEYNQSELSQWTTVTTEETSLSGYFSPILNGGNYRYAVEPYLYWSENNYLVLDYLTDPSEQVFWSSAGANYNKPDPAFILPWAEGQCDHLWSDAHYFSSDIRIDPPIASAGEPITITTTIHNFSEIGNGLPPFNKSFKVSFYRGDPDNGGTLIGEKTVAAGELKSRVEAGAITRRVQWVAEGIGEQHIYAVIDPQDNLAEVHDENDSYVNNNKGYGVLSLSTIEFIDVGQAVEKAYQDIPFQMGDSTPTGTFYLPLNNWTENLRIDILAVDWFEVMHSLGTPFEIVAYQTDWEKREYDFWFVPDDGNPHPPAVILVDYAGADLTGFVEAKLNLYRLSSSGWVEATCSDYDVVRFPGDYRLVVPVCQPGIFVLSDLQPEFKWEVFLPTISR